MMMFAFRVKLNGSNKKLSDNLNSNKFKNMAHYFRQTAFDPIDRREFGEQPPVDMSQMEAALAKEMARMKIAEAQK